jgi:hypothetical protein
VNAVARRVVCVAAVVVVLAGPVAILYVLGSEGAGARRVLTAAGLVGLFLVSCLVLCRYLWEAQTLLASVFVIGVAMLGAFAAALVGSLAAYVIIVNAGFCDSSGEGRSGTAWWSMGAVYLAVGGWAFARPRRPLWGWPLAVLAGVAVWVAVQALTYGAHNYCET